MKSKHFIHNDFILETETAHPLYHKYAANKPIINFHYLINPKIIAEDYQYDYLGDMWSGGDHYIRRNPS